MRAQSGREKGQGMKRFGEMVSKDFRFGGAGDDSARGMGVEVSSGLGDAMLPEDGITVNFLCGRGVSNARKEQIQGVVALHVEACRTCSKKLREGQVDYSVGFHRPFPLPSDYAGLDDDDPRFDGARPFDRLVELSSGMFPPILELELPKLNRNAEFRELVACSKCGKEKLVERTLVNPDPKIEIVCYKCQGVPF